MPGLDDFLKTIKPEVNDGFEVLEGVYQTVVNGEETGYVTKTAKNGDVYSQFQIRVDITDVLDGSGQAGRRVWMRYREDEDGIKKLINDLFTAGILDKVDKSSVAGLKGSLGQIAGSTMYIRCWKWIPEKDMQGNAIPEERREARQQMAVKSAKALKKLIEKAGNSPF